MFLQIINTIKGTSVLVAGQRSMGFLKYSPYYVLCW